MLTNIPLNDDLIEKLLAVDYGNGNFKEIKRLLVESASSNSRKHINPHIFLNRKSELKKIIDFYRDESQKLLIVGGVQGTGKTSLIRSSLFVFNPDVLLFYFECSTITNLDDILLNFCSYFDRKYRFDNKNKQNMSIDVRLLSYLKNLDKPLIVAIDNIEHLVSSKNTIDNEDLKHFLNYLHTHQKIKLILSGQKLPSEDIDLTMDFVTQIRITGLNELDSLMLLKNYFIEGDKNDFGEIYKISRGYPWLLILTIKLFSFKEFSFSKIVKDLKAYNDSYESFLIGNICSKLLESEKCVLNYLATFRHPVGIEVLKILIEDEVNLQPIIEHLYKLGLIKNNYSRYYLNNTVRKIHYDSISPSEKFIIHTDISKFYSKENNKRLAERILKLSRNLLHSEQIFHNLLASKVLPEKEKGELKQKILANYYSPGIKDYYGAISTSNTKNINTESVSLEDKKTEKINLTKTLEIEGVSIELNEEEKALLNELGEEKVLSHSNQTQTIETGHIIEMDWSKEAESTIVFDQTTENNEEHKQSLLLDIIESFKFVAQTYAKEMKNDLAIERYNETIELCKQNDLQEELAKTFIMVAEVYTNLKQYERSLSYYQEAEQILLAIDKKDQLAFIAVNMGKVYLLNYQHDRALQLYNNILKMPNKLLTNYIKGLALMGMAEVFDYRNQLEDALEFYSLAKESFEQIGDNISLANLHSRTGLIYDDLGEYEKAIQEYEKSLELDKELGNKQNYSITLANLAAIYDEIDDKKSAVRYYKKSIILDRELNNIEGLYKTFSRLGTIYSEVEEFEKAHKYYQQELKISKKIKDPYLMAMAYLDIGDLYYYIKDYTKSAKCFLVSEKLISNTISTDSKEKIERRISKLLEYISKEKFENLRKQVFQGKNND